MPESPPQLLVLARGGDLARRACLANAALASVILAAAGAAVAAFFGDIAFDRVNVAHVTP